MNPEIIYAGDRNRINATLSKLVIEFDKLERKKVLLMWKLWIKNGEEFGRLYHQKKLSGIQKAEGVAGCGENSTPFIVDLQAWFHFFQGVSKKFYSLI